MATKEEKTPTIKDDAKIGFWDRTPFEAKATIVIGALTIFCLLPGACNDYSAYMGGPNITVSAISGPYESPKSVNDPTLEKMTWFSRIKLGNNGNQPATDVYIPWESGGYATVVDIEGKKTSDYFTKKLDLGKLPKDTTIEISLWTEEEFSGDGSVTPKVNHSTGFVRIFEEPFLPWYRDTIRILYWCGIAMAFFSVWFCTYRFKRAEKEMERENDKFLDEMVRVNREEMERRRKDLDEYAESLKQIYEEKYQHIKAYIDLSAPKHQDPPPT